MVHTVYCTHFCAAVVKKEPPAGEMHSERILPHDGYTALMHLVWGSDRGCDCTRVLRLSGIWRRGEGEERTAEIEIQRETEGEMQLRDAEIAPQKNKDFVLTRVSPKYSQKYSINIPLPASQTVTTGMLIMKTLRIGLRGTRDTLAESLTYFCRCSSLMRLQPKAWRASSPSSCACVLFTHCFLHVPVLFVWLCWCVPVHARGNIIGS